MIKNILLITFRNIRRHKAYSFINIIGLAIGIACAVVVFLYINNELTYDKYLPDYDKLYRINREAYSAELVYNTAGASAMLIPTLRNDFPQIECATRFYRGIDSPLRYKDIKMYVDRPYRADEYFFKIFKRKFLDGSAENVLSRPNTAVITNNLKEKIFGDEDPYGEIIYRDSIAYEIVGIIENWPSNSHLKPSLILSIEPHIHERENDWGGYAYSYVKLKENIDVEKFGEEILNIEQKYNKKEGDEEGIGRTTGHFIMPITDIHLNSDKRGELTPQGNTTYLVIFGAIGLLILLIACINYMNLTTAKFLNRTREIGIRKTLGAERRILIFQFLFESFVFVFIAHVLAMFIVEFSMPYINNILNTHLTIPYTSSLFIISLSIIIVFTSLISGSYPAFFLSSFNPITIFQGKIKSRSFSVWFRKALVIFQFTISVSLIISVIVIHKQLSYMRDYPMGFDKEQKLVLRFPREVVKYSDYKSVKQEFQKIPQVKSCCFTSAIPGEWNYGWRTWLPGEEKIRSFLVNYYQVDEDFVKVFDIEIIAGTELIPEYLGNGIMELIINEEAIKIFGWASPEDAIGKNVWDKETVVSGVFRNFNFKGLQNKIEPMAMFQMSEDFKIFALDINTVNFGETLAEIEKTFHEILPNYPFEYFFLDENFDKQYKNEEQISKTISLLSILGIFISCLGLLGLASFMAQQKTKEIGIRKVNGATIKDIVFLLVNNFSKLVIISNIIAWPVTYYLMSIWLDNFAYSTDLSWWIFILAGFTSLFMAISTVIYQALKAARSNPVDALKYE